MFRFKWEHVEKRNCKEGGRFRFVLLFFFASRLRRDLFPTIGTQAFSYDRYNIFPGLSYIKSNNTFLNSVRKSDVEAQVEVSFNVTERARVTCYWCKR